MQLMAGSMLRSLPGAMFLVLHCRNEECLTNLLIQERMAMLSNTFTRRNFTTRLAPIFSAFGLATLLPKAAVAKKTEHQDTSVRKLNDEGKPADGTQFITPIVIHNGLAYIAGVGAHDTGPAESWEIGNHTTKVLDNIKKLVEAAGSDMDNIVQLGVFLAK